jgi:hypothetical protein
LPSCSPWDRARGTCGRAVARAPVVVPADVSSASAIASPSVSIESVREGDYVHVTIAFN